MQIGLADGSLRKDRVEKNVSGVLRCYAVERDSLRKFIINTPVIIN